MENKSKILVLGNRGFLGATLFDHLVKQGESETIGFNSSTLDLTIPGSHSHLSEIANKNTTVIVAARAPSQPDPLKTFNQDLAITCNIVQFLENSPVKKLINLSSISVYGEEETDLSISEKTRIAPSSYYGVSKFTTEELLRQAAKEYEIPLVNLRPCMIYGPGHFGLPYGPDRMVNSLIKSNKVEVFGDGSDRRDFLYIKDFIEIVKKFISENCFGTYNLGTGNNYSPMEIIQGLQNILGKDFPVIELKRVKPKINQKLDVSKLREVLKNYVFTSLENGLQQSLNALQSMSSFGASCAAASGSTVDDR